MDESDQRRSALERRERYRSAILVYKAYIWQPIGGTRRGLCSGFAEFSARREGNRQREHRRRSDPRRC
jgi:hypothetical protein